MDFNRVTLTKLAVQCQHLLSPDQNLEKQIALELGWDAPYPCVTSSLDAVRLLIDLLGEYTHYGILRQKTGEYSAFLTIWASPTAESRMWVGTNNQLEVPALCAATLFGLAGGYEEEG